MKITKTKTFGVAKQTLQAPVEIKFMNKKGSFDSLQFSKYKVQDIRTRPQTYSTANAEKVGKVETQKTTTYFSLWLDSEKSFHWLEELFSSPVVYVNNRYVRVKDSSYRYDNSEKLFSFELEVQPEFEVNNIRL